MATDNHPDSLRVPTRPITVELFNLENEHGVRGTMFHGESLYERGTAADIADELNDDRTFIPFLSSEGFTEPTLLNKRHILRIHVPGLTYQELPLEDQATPSESCTAWLTDGSCRTGRAVVDTRAAASRRIDKFNHAPKFVTFLSEHGVDFIHTAHIVRIDRDT